MSSIYITTYKTPFGELLLGDFKNTLVLADWKYRKQREVVDFRIKTYLNSSYEMVQTAFHEEVMNQFELYFDKKCNTFTLPLTFAGTAFQQAVWQLLLEIPYGTVVSYETLSRKLNNPEAIRAVAAANGANALSIIVPCHRVIGKDGSLTGYAGGLNQKQKLLQLEGYSLNDPAQLALF